MATRTVRGRVQGLDNTEGNRVSFRIMSLTASGAGVRYPSSVDAETDVNGDLAVDLLTNQTYRAVFPDGSEGTFYLDDDTDDADLDQLLFEAAAATNPTVNKQFDAYIKSRLPTLVKPYVDEAAANVTQGAAGKSILSAPRNPLGSEGNSEDTFINPVSGDVFKKTGSAWGAAIGNIKGPPGNPGAPGNPGNPGAPGNPGQSVYAHVRYAEDAAGRNISLTPTPESRYISILMLSTATAPSNVAFDAGWVQLRGDPGAGDAGDAGQSAYVFIRYAENAQGLGTSETPGPTSTHIAILSKTEDVEPTNAELTPLWRPYIVTPAGGGSSAPLPPLVIKLSEVTAPTLQIPGDAAREYIVWRDANKPIELIGYGGSGARYVLTTVAPRTGTVHPVNLLPNLGETLPYTARRGYADSRLYKSYNGRIYRRDALLDFPYDPFTQYWTDGGGICYLFDADDNPLKNRIADADHLVANQGTQRTPYGIDTVNGQYAYSNNWLSVDVNGPFYVHWVLFNLADIRDGYASVGLSSRTEPANYIRLNTHVASADRKMSLTLRNDVLYNGAIGPVNTFLQLPADVSSLISLLLSRDAQGRYNLRCLNNGQGLKVGGVADPLGYYPGGDSAKVSNFVGGLGATFGGIYRTAAAGHIGGDPTHVRYTRARSIAYSEAEAKASHNLAADWIAATDPTGPQLAKLL